MKYRLRNLIAVITLLLLLAACGGTTIRRDAGGEDADLPPGDADRADSDLAAGIYPRLLEALARRLAASHEQLLDLYGSEQRPPW